MTEENPNPQDQPNPNPNAASSDADDVDRVLSEASELTDAVANEVGADTSEHKPQFQLDPGDTRRPEIDVETQIDQISEMVDEMADAVPELPKPESSPEPASKKPPEPEPTQPPPPVDDANPIEKTGTERQQKLEDALTDPEPPIPKRRITFQEVLFETIELFRSGAQMSVQGVLRSLDFLDDTFSFVSYDIRRMFGWAAAVFATAAASIAIVSWT